MNWATIKTDHQAMEDKEPNSHTFLAEMTATRKPVFRVTILIARVSKREHVRSVRIQFRFHMRELY